MFELLFNYPVELWQQARLGFDTALPLWGLPAAFAIVMALILISLWRREISVARRSVIAVLQGLVAALALTMIWQPVLQVSVSERGENTVAWVMDTSRSMALRDVPAGGALISGTARQSRLDAGRQALDRLAITDSDDFTARSYELGRELKPLASMDALSPEALAVRSNIAPGLDELLGTVSESALAAVVLISDGADNSDQVDSRWWQNLAAAGVPVHTVGVGQAADPADLELSDVFMPDTAQPNTEILARLRIRHSDAGGLARLRVLSGTELLAAEDVRLPDNSTESVHTLRFSSGDSGTRQLEFTVEPSLEDGAVAIQEDPMPSNNRQPRILRVVDAPKRILYVEGEPRWEYKFLRRAMEAHPGVTVVSLLRTSPNKFYRQGVSDGEELADGFPQTREQLFVYDAVVIGSLEAAELSTAQQSALRDFVSERGGTLLMLGGRQGLADGGWGRSVVAAALPVQLVNRPEAQTFTRERTRAMPSLTGLRTPWLQLAEGTQANIDAWQSLPELADFQSLGQVKPGALTLLERQAGDNRAPEPLLVAQRYGRGQSLVLGTSGSWRWQMRLPSEDMRHERFWRQLLGMTVEQSLPRLRLQPDKPLYRDADSARLSLVAYNADYTDLQVSELPVSFTDPDGMTQVISLYPENDRPGHYSGQVPLNSDGPYSITVSTPLDGESPSSPLSTIEQWWVRESGDAEDFGSGLRSDFLQRISDVTGGSYLPLDDIDRLDTVLAAENAALKRESHLPLWNMPFLFICLILFKLVEWMLRLSWKRL